MSFGQFLAGSLELVAIALALGFAAVRLRGRMLPGWSGAPARLAEIVLGLSLLVVVLELVGVVGLYRPGWVLAACLVVGIGLGLYLGTDQGPTVRLPSPAIAPYALAVAVVGALLVALHWTMPTQTGLDIGMYLPNTTWHNAPFATRFIQEHQVGAIHFTEVLRLTVWFYPQNSELLHSAPQLFLGTDFVSPLINFGWMALCLLAAWCFGRPYGAGAAAVLGVALVLDAEMLLLYQPGDAKNDVGGLFFLLASAAILVNTEAQRRSSGGGAAAPFMTWAVVVAGLAAGLALGTKLNLLAPFGLLTLGVIFVAGAGNRVRTGLIWSASALVTGGFWFVRNLVEAGNPLPWFDAGPLPGPEQLEIDIREPHTVSDYVFNLDVIKDTFIPGIHDSFGALWPLTLVALLAGIALAMLRGRTPVVRMLGFVAAASAIAYLFTPLTAAGPLDAPTAFEVNIRYVSPALGLGAMLLAIDPGLSRDRAQPFLLAGLGVLLLVSVSPIDAFDDVWEGRFLAPGILLALLLIAVPVGLVLAAQRGFGRMGITAAAALAVGIAIGVGWARNDEYLDDRYRAATAPENFPDEITSALEWFNEENPTDSRIAVVGGRPGFKQYVFYGEDLSNRVQYVAHEGPKGAFTPIATCEEWRAALNDGDYDYAVIGPDQRSQNEAPVEAEWTRSDPAARELHEDELVSVFELNGDLAPDGCDVRVSRLGEEPDQGAAEPAGQPGPPGPPEISPAATQ